MLNRLRRLLQQPWFVGLLVLIAIGVSVRNIVLPLMRMGEAGVVAANQGETLADTGGMIVRPGQAQAGVSGPPADYPALRARFFSVAREHPRNPFKAVAPPKLVVVEGDVVEEPAPLPAEQAPGLTQALVDKIFTLQAVMSRPGGQLALISREMVKVGEPLRVGYLQQSPDEAIQRALAEGLIAYGMPFRVEKIDPQKVLISREEKQFELLLHPE